MPTYEHFRRSAASLPLGTISVASLALLLFTFPQLQASFEFTLGEDKAPWRILGCHLLHWNGNHLFWDLVMWSALAYLCESRSPGRFCLVTLLAGLLIPLAVELSSPGVSTYRGLSGLDTAMFSLFTASVLWQAFQDQDRTLQWAGGAGLALLAGKSVFELYSGQTLFVSEESFQPLPIAHLVGMTIGLIGSWPIPTRFFGEVSRSDWSFKCESDVADTPERNSVRI